MLTPGLWDTVLDLMNELMNLRWAGLTAESRWLLSHIAAWYLIATLPLIMIGSVESMHRLLVGSIKVMLVLWFVVNLQTVTNGVINGVTRAGLSMSGHQITPEEFLSPGRLLQRGLDVNRPVVDYLEQLSIWGKLTNLALKAIFEIGVAFTSLAFMVMAAHVLVLQIVLKLAVFFLLLLLPTVLFRPTAFLAEGTIHDFFRLTIRFGALAYTVGLLSPLLERLAMPPGSVPTHWSVLTMTATAGLFAILTWGIPSFMQLHGGNVIGVLMTGVWGSARAASRAL